MKKKIVGLFVVFLIPYLSFSQEVSEPRTVFVNYAVNRIVTVDYVNHRFEIDFYLQMYWLADEGDFKLPVGQEGIPCKDQCEIAEEDLEWVPTNDFTNAMEVELKHPTIYVYKDGYILADARYYGVFYNDMKLKDFPFDDQELIITLEDFNKTNSELVYAYGTPLNGVERKDDTTFISSEEAFETDRLDFAEFHLNKEVKAVVDTKVYEFTAGGDTFSRLQFILSISRESGFYITKIVSVSVLIVLMSWVVFFMDPKNFIDRSAFGITAFLALIGHNFIINSLLPKISYLTTMDYFTLGTNLLVCIPIIESLLVYRIANRKGVALDQSKLVLIDRLTLVFSLLLLLILTVNFFRKSHFI